MSPPVCVMASVSFHIMLLAFFLFTMLSSVVPYVIIEDELHGRFKLYKLVFIFDDYFENSYAFYDTFKRASN